jgi:N-acetyl sugar amidotransferase
VPSKGSTVAAETTRFGAPAEVKFCKQCVMPNQRPTSCNEWQHTSETKHQFIQFHDDGVCSACKFNEAKEDGRIDWNAREAELLELLERYRSKDGSYDCIVPGSGGKDSAFASHVLKYKYKMHPLTVTWAPHLYTDIGFKNFQNWVHIGGFDNFLYTPNGKIHRLLTRNAFLNLLHPFQSFILGQKSFAVKMAARFDIPLVFYGEPPGEYGANVSIHQKKFALGEKSSSTSQEDGFRLDSIDPALDLEKIYLGGKKVSQYLDEGVEFSELKSYLPLDPKVVQKKKIDFHYLGYYVKWVPQEMYYYASQNTGFQANPVRTEGTYSKYNSIDDKTDGFYYYTQFIKYGFGRATQDASQEIRNHHLTRDEGVALVRRFDGELPKRYFDEFLNYLSMTEKEFMDTCNRFRSDHMWEKSKNEWHLKHSVS